MPERISVAQLVASAARTTQGVSGSVPGDAGVLDCIGYASLSAILSVTTGGLTVTSFRVWLQGSYDYGQSWYGLVHTNVMKIATVGVLSVAAGNLTANSPSLALEVGNVTGTTGYVGVVNNPPPYVRAVWEINGTSPSETFSIMTVLSMVQSN